MKSVDFIEASAYLRVLEKRILSNDSIERIAEASTLEEALRLLTQNSEYDFSQVRSSVEAEKIITEELIKAYEEMYRLAGPANRAVVDLPACKYDFHNLKAALKAKYNEAAKAVAGDIYSSVSQLDMEYIQQYLDGEITEPDDEKLPVYAADAIKRAEEAFGESGDPQDIDIVLDHAMFEHLFRLAEAVGSEFIVRYIKLTIDYYNVKTLLRVKNMNKGSRFLGASLIPGGLVERSFLLANYDKTPDALAGILFYKHFGNTVLKGVEHYSRSENFSELERIFDNELMAHIRGSKLIAFGPEILFSYLISRENEARQIRILVAGKQNQLPSDTLKERLRENYA